MTDLVYIVRTLDVKAKVIEKNIDEKDLAWKPIGCNYKMKYNLSNGIVQQTVLDTLDDGWVISFTNIKHHINCIGLTPECKVNIDGKHALLLGFIENDQ